MLRARPLDFDPALQVVAEDDRMPIALLKQPESLQEGRLAAYLARRKGTPKWLWAVAAGGVVLVLLMMLAMWLMAG